MLTGKALGDALREAISLKGVTQAAVAKHFRVQPPSVQDWLNRGVIAKEKLPELWRYFSDVAGPEHWGLPSAQAVGWGVGPTLYPVDASKVRPIYVVGMASGGRMPERLWADGDQPIGSTDEYAEMATADHEAFLCEVTGQSMYPKYESGNFALVEPNTPPDIEDVVLVRLKTGEVMIKRLLSRRNHRYTLGSYNESEILEYKDEEVSWVYYCAHEVPRKRIKSRF
jgi:hypothetical protein